MKTYKGMDKDMRCRGFQYDVGGEYETERAKACEAGFHACEYPLDVFNYYPPAGSRFFEVEQDGALSRDSDDSKVASTKLRVKAEIGIAEMVKAAVDFTMARAKPAVKGGHSTGNLGAASATGDLGAASATGILGAASATGIRGAASATGDQGAASATGNLGAASATGKGGVALAAGYEGKAMGAMGCAICCVERGDWNGETYPIIAVKAGIVDGETLKPGVWYALKGGEFVEVE